MTVRYETFLARSSIEILGVEDSDHDFPLHFHRKICLGRIDRGSKILVIDGKKHRLRRGDKFFIPAYKPHSCYVEAGQTVSYTVICADNIDQLREGVRSDRAIKAIVQSKGSASVISHDLGQNINLRPLENSKISDLLKYIENNYAEHLTVDSLSAIAGMSAYHLLRLFKRAVGLSLHQYIIQFRIKMFIEKARSRKDMLGVVFSCGFYDQSHLIRNFKKHVGATPLKYINSINF